MEGGGKQYATDNQHPNPPPSVSSTNPIASPSYKVKGCSIGWSVSDICKLSQELDRHLDLNVCAISELASQSRK